MSIITKGQKLTDRWFDHDGNLHVNTKQIIALYSLLFVVLSIGVFIMFILLDRTFVQIGDAYRQGYFWIAEIKHNMASLFSGGGYPTWSWSRGTGLEVAYLTDPFNLLAAAFPWKHLEVGYTLALLCRMYLTGLAFIAFGREVKLPDYSCLLGAVSYAFCTWTVNISLMQARFTLLLVLLPILIFSIDRIYKGKNPLLFMMTVAYYIIENSYLAYMAGIISVLYILLRYFAYNDQFKLSDYIKKIALFIVYGLCGILMSSIILVQRFLRVQSASMESSKDSIDLLYSPSFYCDMGKHIISEGLLDGYSYVGIPIVALIVLIVAFRKMTIKKTGAIMTLIMFVMMLFPFFSSMFNGFSYNSGRWYYMIPFFAIWAAMEVLDLENLKEKKNLILMTIALAVIAVWTIGFGVAGLCDLDRNSFAFIGVNVVSGIAALLVVYRGRKGLSLKARQTWLIVITCVCLVIAWNGSLYGHMGSFMHDEDMYKQLSMSTQRVATQIEDDDFYRVDQVEWINVHKEMKMPANENLWWQSKSIYLYDSKLPETLLDFNKLVGNNYGYSKRVYMLSNDNRAGLDYLFGVRYFLGNDNNFFREGADEYAGYGFEKQGMIDGVNVFKNKYDAGLGFVYDRYMTRSEFEKLNRLEREQALLQAVVVPDDSAKALHIKEIKAADVETDIQPVEYEIADTNGLTIDGNTIKAEKEDASFAIDVKNAPPGQLFISFDDLIKGSGETSGSFKLKCKNERVSESADNELTNQSIYNIRDYDLNMGYYDGYSGRIHVILSEDGTYHFSDLRISSMNMDIYDKYVSQRSKVPYEVTAYDDKTVEGDVTLKEDGILFLSIARNANWDVYVDGTKADKISRANITFMGVEMDKGTHHVVLKYNNGTERLGLAVSLAGLLIALLIALIYRRKQK